MGTVVAQNDIVAKIDSSVAGLQLASDKANVARLTAQVKYDKSQAIRLQNLFQQNAIATSTRDQAISTRDMDVASLAQARAAMSKSQYQFDHSNIRAPFPGRVVQRLINPGEYATAGKDIVRLVDIGSMEVSVQTPIDTAHYIHEGLALTVDIENRPVIANVRAIVPVGDIASRSLEVRITLPPGAGLVGDAAKVYVPSAPPHDVLAVPRDALVLREDNTYVFKVDGKNVAQRVAVETGSEDGTLVEVHGLLSAGRTRDRARSRAPGNRSKSSGDSGDLTAIFSSCWASNDRPRRRRRADRGPDAAHGTHVFWDADCRSSRRDPSAG